MNNQWLMLKQVEEQLREWQLLNKRFGRPRIGWIKTLRQALGMTAQQLASRIGVTRGRMVQIENAEVADAITLRSLKNAAAAMGCEVVYAIVPVGSYSLEDIVRARANQIAAERIARVAHSMSLEAQTVKSKTTKRQKEQNAQNLRDIMNKKLWKDK
jgi:predicted DNA-binding mobile mystery protein A